ncbi:MAG: uracil-DNA glycosylase [Woeseiaceae bacterium]
MADAGVENRRRAYLQALEIDVYALRGKDAVDPPAPDPGVGAQETDEQAAPDWTALQTGVAACTQCILHKTRTQTVFGVGSRTAEWMIVGEAPGAEEDRRGEPFVGRAGKLLDEMLRAIGLSRERVYIANILKCRPPNNRDPANDEAESCRRFLDRQIELVAPKIIIAVGRIAAQRLLQTDAPLGRLRQQKHYLSDRQVPVVVTYHPAYLLRSPTQKRKAWQDLCFAADMMNEGNK